ncbi:MAG: hypothetical protein GWN00_10950, partial [Aliifodinibius sp.]|nr:hypothetical protein [Fodinibius sp.]NIV12455.1 hypothetical protein [Fodinibius sp.]NIY25303.1 hypothetical protein [Fodinibius sp.]
MLRSSTIVVLIWSLLFFCGKLLAVEADTTAMANLHQVELKDGSRLIGIILKEDQDSVTFKTASQVAMVIPRERIKTMRSLSGEMVAGEFWRSDPNRTRLL